MNTQSDFRSELDYWTDLWADMEQEDHHPPVVMPKQKMSPFAADILGDPSDDESEDSILQEEKIANPVFPDSVGPDSVGPKPVWVSEDLLEQIEKLKNQLFKIENEVAKMGQGKKLAEKAVLSDSGSDFKNKINSIKQQIDKISSQLGIENEPSPYNVK